MAVWETVNILVDTIGMHHWDGSERAQNGPDDLVKIRPIFLENVTKKYQKAQFERTKYLRQTRHDQ
jgi:hypothetical protein